MIELEDLGVIDGMRLVAVFLDGQLIGHNMTPLDPEA